MSQQSILIDSFHHAKPRYGSTASHAFDVLAPVRHQTLSDPAYPIKREVSSQGTPAFDTEILFQLPNSGFLHHMELRTVLADTTTENYSDYPGAVICDEVEYRSDNEILHQYKYAPVFNYYLSKLKNEETRDKVLLACGGTNVGTSGPTTVMTPIPTFHDPLINPGCRPLNLSKFKKAPELIIKTRTLANSVKPTSTGGSITSMVLVMWMSETSYNHRAWVNSLDSFHHAIDFSTNVLNSVANSTATNIDISGFNGNNKRLIVTQRAESEVDTNKQYYIHTEIDELKTILDGHEEFVFKTKEEGEADYIKYSHGYGFSSTLGYPYIVPYSYFASPQYQHINMGGLHSARVHKHQLKITHSVGASQYIDVLAIKSAIYKYVDGGMVRLL